MGPLLESVIVVRALEAIHPKLPGHVVEHYGYLFNPDTPNFCDIQPHVWCILDTLLKELSQEEGAPKCNKVYIDLSLTQIYLTFL